MVNESSQPKPGDSVIGGNNPPPIGAAVLGGIEGVKQRCANPDFQARIAGLREAVKHGEPGIELLLHGLKDEVSEVGLLAYSLLQENVEPESKKLLEIYEPWEGKISNLNIVDPVALFHSYLEIKQPQNSSLYEAIQILDRGTAAEKEVAFLQLKGREEPVVKAAFLSYVNAATQLSETHKFLKYFLEMNLFQEAKQVSEKMLSIKYGHKEVMKIYTCYGEPDKLQYIHQLWQGYAIHSLIKGQEPLDFFTALNSRIQAAMEKYDNQSDLFSRRSYSESHE